MSIVVCIKQVPDTAVGRRLRSAAPIFEIGDLGIVGDLFTVVPQLIEGMGKRK